ncbi:bifunctional YncE family protein/alkaline phosphatase family protein [Desulfotomaculum copahuensis]|uniref:bifunctional YncE family protein/alkaline phosphatase family protein n=1 Tax=Desulfotomaculum copahuensis TaxID=1838280 RepID=UPI0013737B64|nr:bifunctional YncE family protein/alkaline phosphatase family protein [Desulfotomaculum copahuensis]
MIRKVMLKKALGLMLTLTVLSWLVSLGPVYAEGRPDFNLPGRSSGAMAAWKVVAGRPAGLLESPAGRLPAQITSLSSAVLPDGRLLKPYGKQIAVGDLPLNMVESPDHKLIAVANAGAGIQSVTLLSTATGSVIQTIKPQFPANGKENNEMYAGIAFTPDSKTIFVAGGGANLVYQFTAGNNGFTQTATIPVAGYPASLAMSPDGSTLYVTDNLADSITALHFTNGKVDKQNTIPVGKYPYAIAVSADGSEIYVTNWVSSSLSIVNTITMRQTGEISLGAPAAQDTPDTGTLPGSLVLSRDGKTAYVAETDNNAIAVVDLAGRSVKRISVNPYPKAPFGIAPNGLCLSPDGNRLYVTEGMLNAVGVYSLAGKTWLGQVPVGWYPTAVLADPVTGNIFVANSNGMGSGPNVQEQWVGSMIAGTVSMFASPSGSNLVETTGTVVANTVRRARRPAGSPIPVVPGTGPIKHVVLIVRENKTYDEEFGDIKNGNGDPALTTFGAVYTPNSHSLATTFGLMDNYYVDGEVTAQGHQWVAGAGPNDYVQRTWPAYYSGRGRNWDSGIPGTVNNLDTYGWEQNIYDPDDVAPMAGPGSMPATYPKMGYLFNDALRHNISFLDYGEFVEHDPVTGDVLPAMKPHMVTAYPGWNLKIPDTERAAYFTNNLKKGILPRFSYVFLMDDHTAGTTPGYPNPNTEVANNDYATGQIIDAVSHSKYWKDTAVFVVEDDAQSGGDHVDAHRSIVMVASPYAKRHAVIDTHYDQMSVLKTIELITGMTPLTVNDAYATPMWDVFTSKPDFTPFNLKAEDPGTTSWLGKDINTSSTVDAALSRASNMTQPEDTAGETPGNVQRKILDDYAKSLQTQK